MKEISSLPKGCALNDNVVIYKHTALKLDNPTLILNKKYNLKKLAYYISFGEHVIDKTNISSIGRITYYNEFGQDLLSEYYFPKDRYSLFQTRFIQLQKGVVQVG